MALSEIIFVSIMTFFGQFPNRWFSTSGHDSCALAMADGLTTFKETSWSIMLRSCRMHDMHFGSKIKKYKSRAIWAMETDFCPLIVLSSLESYI